MGKPIQQNGAMLAASLAHQLERLQAMREAAARLFARDRKGRDFFARGEKQPTPNFYVGRPAEIIQAYCTVTKRCTKIGKPNVS